MKHEIILAPEAIQDFHRLTPYLRVAVREAIGGHLRYEPTKASKGRIKRLRGMHRPQYRLRVDENRVFYDVSERIVEILAIVPKS